MPIDSTEYSGGAPARSTRAATCFFGLVTRLSDSTSEMFGGRPGSDEIAVRNGDPDQGRTVAAAGGVLLGCGQCPGSVSLRCSGRVSRADQ